MRLGKLPYSILKRSVWKQTGRAKAPILQGAGAGIDSAALFVSGDVLLTETTAVLQDEWALPAMMARLTGDLAAEGGHPVGVEAALTLPESCEEPELHRWMEQLTKLAEEQEIQVIGGHTTTLAEVVAPIATLTMVGGRAAWTPGRIKPGDQLIVSGWIGMEGTALLTHRNRELLGQHYTDAFLQRAEDMITRLSPATEAAVAGQHGVIAMHNGGEGGVIGALWEFAEYAGLGFEADLKQIPIRQETVEICEFLEKNPYELASGGLMLYAAREGEPLADILTKAGYPARRIGTFTGEKARILHNEDEIRYLDRPGQDAIWK